MVLLVSTPDLLPGPRVLHMIVVKLDAWRRNGFVKVFTHRHLAIRLLDKSPFRHSFQNRIPSHIARDMHTKRHRLPGEILLLQGQTWCVCMWDTGLF